MLIQNYMIVIHPCYRSVYQFNCTLGYRPNYLSNRNKFSMCLNYQDRTKANFGVNAVCEINCQLRVGSTELNNLRHKKSCHNLIHTTGHYIITLVKNGYRQGFINISNSWVISHVSLISRGIFHRVD